ncbi:DUF3226 domain-containing protein [Pseudanabaena minima]|uniref:DUF3226 domain-containing protein n=1 Tax=Pseudanabaena minima TaxID=890415 RepID=UPI003DA9AAA4
MVEGNHDQAFVERVFRKLLGFSAWDHKTDPLESLWQGLVPSYNPKKTKEYYTRINMPTILNTDDLSIAIYVGEGSNLLENLIGEKTIGEKTSVLQNISDALSNLNPDAFSGFGIILDADKKTPDEIAKTYCDKLKEYFPNFPNQAGTVVKGLPNLGIYILPNNSDQGVLDTLLCDCGEVAYPIYMQRARAYINQFSEIKWKRFDKDKATIATVASVLKPGKTNTTSIADDKWISSDTAQQIPAIQSLVYFLRSLIEI